MIILHPCNYSGIISRFYRYGNRRASTCVYLAQQLSRWQQLAWARGEPPTAQGSTGQEDTQPWIHWPDWAIVICRSIELFPLDCEVKFGQVEAQHHTGKCRNRKCTFQWIINLWTLSLKNSMSSAPETSHCSYSLPFSSSKGTTILQSTGHHRLVKPILEFYANRIIAMCSFVSGVYAFIKWVSMQLFKIMKEFCIIWYAIHQDIWLSQSKERQSQCPECLCVNGSEECLRNLQHFLIWGRGTTGKGGGMKSKFFVQCKLLFFNMFMYLYMGAELLSCVQLFCGPMDCSQPGLSVHGISQARVLEWIAIPFSRGSSWLRDRTLRRRPFCVFCIGRQVLYRWATWEAPVHVYITFSLF